MQWHPTLVLYVSPIGDLSERVVWAKETPIMADGDSIWVVLHRALGTRIYTLSPNSEGSTHVMTLRKLAV
ncbi:MAG: hypothetical protein ACFB0E_02075 [Leptolyngbyaceae cyanobacterium]